jgi:hypothetical protein
MVIGGVIYICGCCIGPDVPDAIIYDAQSSPGSVEIETQRRNQTIGVPQVIVDMQATENRYPRQFGRFYSGRRLDDIARDPTIRLQDEGLMVIEHLHFVRE